jgi:hypothetical protein
MNHKSSGRALLLTAPDFVPEPPTCPLGSSVRSSPDRDKYGAVSQDPQERAHRLGGHATCLRARVAALEPRVYPVSLDLKFGPEGEQNLLRTDIQF